MSQDTKSDAADPTAPAAAAAPTPDPAPAPAKQLKEIELDDLEPVEIKAFA